MQLLERERELAVLERLLDEAAQDRGRVALIVGEAGIGKSSLVAAFLERVHDRARVLVGACEDLLVPQPFGPFRDMATGTASPLRRALDAGAEPEAMLAAIRLEAANPLEPTVMVVEDLHWADDATLDAVRLLARRIDTLPCLLLLTFREDELTSDHALWAVLGSLTGDAITRLHPARLSAAAVERMAAVHERSGRAIHEVTGGNPFFVAELLAYPGAAVPPTVRDAVLARLRRLPPPAASAIENLSVVTGRVAWPVVDRVAAAEPGALEEAEARGFLTGDAHGVSFRHEILRRAIEQSLPAVRRMRQHSTVLDALLDTDADRARLLHHAVEAQRGDVLLRHAPPAAAEAGRMGSHSQAVRLYAEVLPFAADLDPAEQAELRRRYALELVLVNRAEEGADEAATVVDQWESLGDLQGLGRALVTRSHACYWALDPACALAAAERAVAVLEPLPPGPARAMAHAQLAWVLLMRDRYAAGETHARQALALAEQANHDAIRAYALSQLGAALVMQGDASGEAHGLEALGLARRIGHHEYTTVACMMLVSGLFARGRLADAEHYMELGLAGSDDRELDVGAATLLMMRGGLDLSRGAWDRADAAFTEVLRGRPRAGWGETVAHALYGRLLARRGDPRAQEHLERAWSMALRSGEVRRIGPAGAALAEWGFLIGDHEAVIDRVARALELTDRSHHAWYRGETARYLMRAGGAFQDVASVAPVWRAGLEGRWREAAEHWRRSRWPYEEALELIDSGDETATLEGLSILDDLGAIVPARIARGRLRQLGLTHVPRGPSRVTRANPARLTARQLDVLAHLAQGLTNAEIADRLFLSVRTVDHHVSAVLEKLSVGSRHEAAAAAESLGIELQPPL